MVSTTASTRQPPAGGPKATVDLDGLLQELRQGDRDAFARYFRLFRAPVHHTAWLLLGDEQAAAVVTKEALVGAFRRAILADEAADLRVITYSCLVEAYAARAEGAAGVETEPRRRRHARGDDLRQRFVAALWALEARRREALVLHDVAGLDVARSAAVLGIAEDAAGALLFRAREEFRAGLHAGAADETCRQAEEATAGAVGRSLDEEELTRLRHHAAYCRPCRGTMKVWAGATGGASVAGGLALVLAAPPLPQALAATPVFGGIDAPVAGRSGARALAVRTGGLLRSRAAAWALAVVCLAVAAGLVVHGVGVRPTVLLQSVGPAIRLVVAPLDGGATPAEARAGGRSSERTAGAIGVSAATQPSAALGQTPAGSAAPPAGSATPSPQRTPSAAPTPAPTAAPAGGTSGNTGSGTVTPAAAKDAGTSKVAARAADSAAKAARSAARVGAKAAKPAAKAGTKATKASTRAAKASAKVAAEAAKSSGKATKTNGKGTAKSSKPHGTSTAAKGQGSSHSSKKGG
jgi:DNA-directed RNA polymerase specialized sigma24 family protein